MKINKNKNKNNNTKPLDEWNIKKIRCQGICCENDIETKNKDETSEKQWHDGTIRIACVTVRQMEFFFVVAARLLSLIFADALTVGIVFTSDEYNKYIWSEIVDAYRSQCRALFTLDVDVNFDVFSIQQKCAAFFSVSPSAIFLTVCSTCSVMIIFFLCLPLDYHFLCLSFVARAQKPHKSFHMHKKQLVALKSSNFVLHTNTFHFNILRFNEKKEMRYLDAKWLLSLSLSLLVPLWNVFPFVHMRSLLFHDSYALVCFRLPYNLVRLIFVW